MAFTRKIFHGTLPTVKLKLFNSPMRNSFVLWPVRAKICGKNAATVSAFKSGGTWLAIIKPSYKATTAPATPGSAIARATISPGVAPRDVKSVPGEACRLNSVSLGGSRFEK